MEPTSPTGDSGRRRPLARAWSVGVALFGAVLMALITENVAFGIGWFVWMMATDIGNRRQVFGRRTERLWILTTATVYVAVTAIWKLAS
jgi:hypothetical protein